MKNIVLVVIGSLLVLAACRGRADSAGYRDEADEEAINLCYARNLRLISRGQWVEAQIVNPWDTTTLLQTLALVPREIDADTLMLPAQSTVVKIPLERSLVTTSVIIGLLEELGADRYIAGVTDVPYIKAKDVSARIEKGEIADCGAWMAPDIERIIKLNPDAILLSPYQDGGSYGHITDLGIPLIYAADYTELSPLGRSEWMKFYGLLYGRGVQADSIFSVVSESYNSLKAMADNVGETNGRPVVMLDTPYMGVWYVNGKDTATDIFIRDAGGINPFAGVVEGSSVGIAPEKYLMVAKDADVWLQRYLAPDTLTLDQLDQQNPIYRRFRPFTTGNVWGCNTIRTQFFEETPFHPDYFLHDLAAIFHPSLGVDSLRYFRRME